MGSEVIYLNLEMGEPLQIRPSSEKEHEFGEANVFPLGPPYKTGVRENFTIWLGIDVKVAKNKLVDMFEHPSP